MWVTQETEGVQMHYVSSDLEKWVDVEERKTKQNSLQWNLALEKCRVGKMGRGKGFKKDADIHKVARYQFVKPSYAHEHLLKQNLLWGATLLKVCVLCGKSKERLYGHNALCPHIHTPHASVNDWQADGMTVGGRAQPCLQLHCSVLGRSPVGDPSPFESAL